jgi:hypothetical protein
MSAKGNMSVADWLELKGARTMAQVMLRGRFGEIPAEAVARIEAADEPQLHAWLKRAVTAATLDDALTPT